MARGAKDTHEGADSGPRLRQRPTDRYAAVRDRRRGERAEAKRLTRQALIEAGLEEIIDNGLDASLDAISARAGYTRGAFYVHFKGREDFFVAITEWMLDAIVESLLGGERARDGVATMVMRFLDALGAGTWPLMPRIRVAAIRLMDAVGRWPALRERVDDLIVKLVERITASVHEAQQLGLVRRDIDPAKLGTMLTVMAMGTIMLHDVGIPIDLDPDRSALLKMISEASTSAYQGSDPTQFTAGLAVAGAGARAAPASAQRRRAPRGAGASPRRAKRTRQR